MRRRRYFNLELELSGSPSGYRVRVLDSPAGQAAAEFSRTPTLDRLLSEGPGLHRLATFPLGANGNGPLKAFGMALFQTIFTNEVLVCLGQSLVEARGAGAGLRIKLRLSEAPELAALPWEYLYYPAQDRFLALSTETPLVHFLELSRKAPPLAVSLPLRVLLVISAPSDLEPLDTAQEWEGLLTALADLEQQGALVLDLARDARLDTLQTTLRKRDYHVLHFVGHGAFRPEQQDSVLMFCDDSGRAEAVQAQDLAVVLGDSPSLRLVVLNACESSRSSAADIFSGAAQTLVQQGIPAVIAMQSQVADQVAITLTREFYAALADNFPVDAALTEARKAIYTQFKGSQWGVPRLVMHAGDGLLWDIDEPWRQVEPSAAACFDTKANVLARLMQIPEVRARAVAFRTDFEAASEQINLLGNYKDLHDLLHNLQFLCYNGIVQEAKRFPEDDMALGILMDHELTFQDFVCRLQEVAGRPSMPAGEMGWIQELVQAQMEIRQAIELLDEAPLKRAIWLVKRVLDRHPTRINERLNATARTLRLSTIQQAMLAIRAELSRLNLPGEQMGLLDEGIQALDTLNSHLARLVDDHDQWQAIDLELRRVEAIMIHDLTELEMSWPDLRARATVLCRASSGEWAQMIQKDCESLECALAVQNPIKVRLGFQRFRRQVGNRFYQVDTDLKGLCDELRTVGQPLAATLRMLV